MDHEIMMRLLWIAEGHDVLRRAGQAAHAGGGTFAEAAARLPFILGELSNAVDDCERLRAPMLAYMRDPVGQRHAALEWIYEHSRSATLPGESWVTVEAWAQSQMGEVAA